MSRSLQTVIIVAIVLMAGVVVVRHLPMAGYDSDVTQVGQGRPAVVLVFESFSPTSIEAMDVFDQVRRDYAERLDFLVADIGTPRGREFVDRHNVHVGQVLTFRADGTRVRVAMLEGGAQAFRERLREDLAL
jgi:hypothetical protein